MPRREDSREAGRGCGTSWPGSDRILGAAPVECSLETFLESDARCKSEQGSGLRDIGLRVAYIPGARLAVKRLQVRSGHAVHRAEELVQRNASPRGHVDDFS